MSTGTKEIDHEWYARQANTEPADRPKARSKEPLFEYSLRPFLFQSALSGLLFRLLSLVVFFYFLQIRFRPPGKICLVPQTIFRSVSSVVLDILAHGVIDRLKISFCVKVDLIFDIVIEA